MGFVPFATRALANASLLSLLPNALNLSPCHGFGLRWGRHVPHSRKQPYPMRVSLQVIYEGYLEKKGGYTSKWGRRKAALCGQRWQSRFVQIRRRTLYYFASKVIKDFFCPP